MKTIIVTAALVAAFFISTTSVQATNNDCDWKWVNGHLQYICKTPRPTSSPTLSPSPTGTPYATTTATPSATPNSSPSDSPAETAIPTTTPGVTTNIEGTPRTDLSDGRSDGLGCSVKDCSGNKVAGQSGQILPSTGQDTLGWALIIGGTGLGIGVLIRYFFKIVKEDYKTQVKRFGGEDE